MSLSRPPYYHLCLLRPSAEQCHSVTHVPATAQVRSNTAFYSESHAMHTRKARTIFAAEQNPANLRAGLLASTLNGLAAMQGDMAPESVIVSIGRNTV